MFFDVCPCTLIAVTGSDGKTTTTTIIAELLKAAGKTVHVGGNIGNPLLCQADEMRPEDYAVLELSSFQLMTMRQSPHIAVVTNLAPNHLDMHKDMAEYMAAKENIFRYQKPPGTSPFSMLDNDITRRAGRAVPRDRCGISAAGRSRRTACFCGARLSSAAKTDRRRVVMTDAGHPPARRTQRGELYGGHRCGGRSGARRGHPRFRPAASTAWSTASSWCAT